MSVTATTRRFKIEPVETTFKSSKDCPLEFGSSQRPRRFVPEPIETSFKTSRRLAPEPPASTSTEISTGSNFQPEPIQEAAKPTRQFAAGSIETSTRCSRKKFVEDWNSETTNAQKKERPPRKPRKFVPQLVETAQRSRRAGSSSLNLEPTDRTEAMPVGSQSAGLPVPSPPANTPTFDYSQNPLFAEIRRATSPLTRRRPLKRLSQHCFRIPDLDAIESSESEGSTPSSPMCHFAYFSGHAHSCKEPTRVRESADERTSGYLLELAAKAAEKQLREQAMAAFPNDDHHEPVDHFVDREDSLGDEVRSRRESSHHEVNWEVFAIPQHRERVEQQQENERNPKRGRQAERSTNEAGGNPCYNAGTLVNSTDKENLGGYQKDNELDCMRKEARPPMLGKDIKFPRCQSPEPARFDTTQGCDVVQKAMCYLTEQSQQAEKVGESLWCGKGNGKQSSQVLSLWGGSNASSRSQSRQSGLWGGCCASSGLDVPKCPTGILTPSKERGDPLSPYPTPSATLLPPTPPASHADFACIDEKLAVERTIDEEFGDDFVTQVYNYLSLGYPSMAQPFDAELSKISGIPISELQQDDHLAEARGYIRLGIDGNLTEQEITEESCMRWRALRIYIREWAKQKPGMAGENIAGGLGTAVRRGSWGI
ncbi:hypothetical protein CC80DRAFT_406553 [Byssothecium circinans]|uniref:Uncharacterized protein n=1 Tax=Byssothecium circinans TaxID=147558 RepID=A0A6A5U1P7_9PLEO|nr:hypothetical protein CC80DRAFT_406553 [Byssothecium circinans]